MSVKLIHGLSPDKCADALLLGGNCYAPRDFISVPCERSNIQKLTIDLAKLTSELYNNKDTNEIDTAATTIPQITVNFGYVVVDTQSSAEVTILDSRQGTPIVPVVFTTPEDVQVHVNTDNIFRVVGPERSDLESKRMGWNFMKSKNAKEYKFKIVFSPKVSGISSTLRYQVQVGESLFNLRCRGCSEGPAVYFSQNVINFGGLYYGSKTKAVIIAYNFSSCNAYFQFDTDNCRSIFRICPVSGTIAPKSSCKLEIVFSPIKPQTFYKRVHCLIHQQKPQYLDLIGLCIPRPYFVELPIDFCVSSADSILLPLPTRTSDEYFCCKVSGLQLSEDTFHFGPTRIIRESTEDCDFIAPLTRKLLSVQSTIPYDIVMEWIPDPTKTFTIHPATTYLNALGNAVFNINFNPSHSDTFYSAQLECYVYPTTYTWPNAGPPWVATKQTRDAEIQCIMNATASEQDFLARQNGYIQGDASLQKNTEAKTTQTDNEKLDQQGISGNSSGAHCAQKPSLSKPTNLELEIFLENGEKYCIFTLKSSRSVATAWQNTEPDVLEDILLPCEIELQPENYPEEEETNDTISPLTAPEETLDQKNRFEESTQKKKNKSSRGNKKKSKMKGDKSSSGSKIKTKKKSKSSSRKSKQKTEKSVRSKSTQKKDRSSSDTKKKSKKKNKSSSNSKNSSSGKKKKSNKQKQSKAKKNVSQEGAIDVLGSGDHGKQGELEKNKTDTEVGSTSIGVVYNNETEDYEENEEEEEEEREEVLTELDRLENESEDVGTQCETRPMTREGEFTLPNEGKEYGPGPTELAIPLCITIRLTGTTYMAPSQPPAPEFVMPSKVLLNVCFPQSSSTGTFMIKNTSDLPLLYSICRNPRNKLLSVKPSIGVIEGHSDQVVMATIKSTSVDPEQISHIVRADINSTDQNQISINCSIERPSLRIKFLSSTKNLKRFICPPTIPNTIGVSYIKFTNTSSFQYRYLFHCQSRSENHQIFFPTPSKGFLEPFDEALITWSFVPPRHGNFKAIWVCTIQIFGTRTDDGEECPSYDIPIPIRGVAIASNIVADPAVLEFGAVILFKKYDKTVRIHNNGKTFVVADLFVYHEQWLERFDKQILELSTHKISIKPGNFLDITVTIKADRIMFYKFYVDYSISGIQNGEGLFKAESIQAGKQRLFEITFIGKHPELQFTKIEHIARHPLWDPEQCASMFQLFRLNKLLGSQENAIQNSSSLTSIPTIQCHLPSSVVGSLPCLFSLELSVREEFEVAWAIHTQPPANSRMYKLQAGDRKPQFHGNSTRQDSPQLLTMLWTEKCNNMTQEYGGIRRKSLSLTAMHNAVNFNVSPVAGVLNPVDKRKVEIFVKFSYEQVGVFRMPILLRVYPAIFLWIELTVRVLHPNEPSLQLPTEMTFHPVRLDDLDPPVQMCHVYNGGDCPVTYVVDTAPFEQLRESNYGHEVIQGLTETGILQPQSWGCIKFRFAPIEYHQYSATVKVRHGDTGAENSSELMLQGWAVVDGRYEGLSLQTLSLTPSLNPYSVVDVSPSILLIPDSIAPQETISRAVVLVNRSEKYCMTFSWPPMTMVHSTSIEIFPDIGILGPKEQYICQIRITGSPVPHILSTSIRCWIEAVGIDASRICCEPNTLSFRSGSYASASSGRMSGSSSVNSGLLGSMSSISRLLHISALIGYTKENEVGKCIHQCATNSRYCEASLSDTAACEDGNPYIFTPDDTTLSKLNSHVVNEIMRRALWDIVMGPTGQKFLNQVLQIHTTPPLFSDYKSFAQDDDPVCAPMLTIDLKKQVLDFVLATMLQEVVDDDCGNSPRPTSLHD